MLKQLCQLIPSHLVSNLARKNGVDKKARTFSPWSHVVIMLYGQLIHAIGLNEFFEEKREYFGAKRKTGARKMRGGQWGELWTARDLQVGPIS
ncbi:MAG TPA: DUF4372 domain-containing protein [Verrucomicrobiales bacterium]|nr:DUF4372 domain-containing protein [Verrucomicrobiales bacterium]HIL72177.1 DUF4372 domain-containing protein [Verrucomicrobiota bacterium]